MCVLGFTDEEDAAEYINSVHPVRGYITLSDVEHWMEMS